MSHQNLSVSSLWIGGPLGQFENTCLASFVQDGYQVFLYSYDKNLKAPDGVQVVDARRIVPEDRVFENRTHPGSFAGFSNIFRYRMLQEEETVWIDTDVISCHNPLPKVDYLYGIEVKSRRKSLFSINGAILGAPRNSELLQWLVAEATSVAPENVVWGSIGPRLILRGLRHFDLVHLAQPRKVLYPVQIREVWKFFDPKQTDWVKYQVRKSPVVHLWNEMYRNHPVKSQQPPVGSFLHERMVELGTLDENLPKADIDWVRNTWRKNIDPKPWEEGYLVRRRGRLAKILLGLTA